MSLYYNKTPRTTVNRHKERGVYDRAVVETILDEGLIGHAGFIFEGQPYVIPMLYARSGERLYLHGSPASRLLGTLGEGAEVCLTVTLLDGLVLARSAFRHSLNYRSVVVLGEGRFVRDKAEKHAALRAIVEQVARGRSDDVRGPSEAELKATEVIRLDMREVSAKVRTGPPKDKRRDYELPVWAGELPLGLEVGTPVPDERNAASEPDYVRSYRRGHA